MKRLILVRHANSDWPENTEDFHRPLSKKGIEEAQTMSKLLNSQNIDVDIFITSPALRAKTTCEFFCSEFQQNFECDNSLYNPSEDDFISLIYGLPPEVNSVALFSHNNGISNFANYISDEIIHLPTCGVIGYEILCESWTDFEMAKKKKVFSLQPNKDSN